MKKRTVKKRTLSEEQKKKMQESKGRNSGKVCEIGDNITILADEYQYILHIKGRTTSYYPAIEMVMQELMEYKEKEFMIASDEKTLLSVHQSIKEARKWLNTIVKPLFR